METGFYPLLPSHLFLYTPPNLGQWYDERENVEALLASFLNDEENFCDYGTGPFAQPAVRAFGY